MAEKIKLDRVFMRSLKPTNKNQEYGDSELKGLYVRVSLTGKISYTLRYTKPDGKDGRRTIAYYPETQPAEARAKAIRELRSIETTRDSDSERLAKRREKQKISIEVEKNITLLEFLEGSFKEWKIAEQKSGAQSIIRVKNMFSSWLNKPICEITQQDAELWVVKRKEQVTAVTANRDLAAIKGVISKAVEWGKVPFNPLAKVKIKGKSEQIIRYLSAAEDKRLMQALDDREQRIRIARKSHIAHLQSRGMELVPDLDNCIFVDYLKPAVILARNTGMRKGEMLALKWEDINLKLKVITIRAANAKSSKTRKIQLNTTANQTLIDWKKQADDIYLFAGKNGLPLADIKKTWLAVIAEAKITNFRWHDLRHDFASRLVMAGVDLNTVRELLGHATLEMTLRYAHLAPEHKAAAVETLCN